MITRTAKSILAALALVGVFATSSYAGDVQGRSMSFKISPQALDSALMQFSDQSGIQLVVTADTIRGKSTRGVQGMFEPEKALERLLEGSGLQYQVVNPRSFAIRAGEHAVETGDNRATDTNEASMRLARANPQTPAAEDKAGAEADDSTSSAEKSRKIDEIIVTATKRAENVQDIPMSIAVIGSQDIERRGLIGMEDYLRSIPGVNQIDNGARANAIVIRGISTSPEFENAAAGAGSTVSSYFDEVPITAAGGWGGGGIDVRPVDIERIEVLRGPQGTAYGSASFGGALRIIPVKPKLDGFGAKLAGAYSGTDGNGSDNSMIQGVVNIPVVANKLALRAVAYRYDESGFYRNIGGVDPVLITAASNFGLGDYVRGPVQDEGRMLSTGGRVAALWRATDKLDLSLNVLTQRIEQDGDPTADAGEYLQSRGPVAPQNRLRGETGEANDTNMDLLSLVLNYDLSWAALTSAVSWVDSGSESRSTLAQRSFVSIYGPSSGANSSDFKSFTAETRLASNLAGRFQFLGGLFYEDVDEAYLQHTGDWPGAAAANPFRTDPIFLYDATRQLEQRAIFGEMSYDLTGKLTATLGGRYYEYEKNQSILQEGGALGLVGGIPRVPIGGGIAQVLDNSESGSSFKANLSYRPTQNALLYASWAEGFRLGRPSPGVTAASCDTNNDGLLDGTSITIESTRVISSDYLDNYEIGAKVALFDRRMVIDTSVYHIKWDGLPIRTIAPVCLANYTANVGAATSDGVEFQAQVFIAKGLRVDFGAGYTKAQLAEDAPGIPGSPKEGARLPGSPKVSANLAAQYDFDIAGHDAFVRADSFYAGKFYGDLLQTPLTEAGDYIKVDVRAGVAIRNLSVELFVRNLTNEDTFTWRGLSNSGRGAFFGYQLRPRTIGLQLGYHFE